MDWTNNFSNQKELKGIFSQQLFSLDYLIFEQIRYFPGNKLEIKCMKEISNNQDLIPKKWATKNPSYLGLTFSIGVKGIRLNSSGEYDNGLIISLEFKEDGSFVFLDKQKPNGFYLNLEIFYARLDVEPVISI